MAAAIAAFFGSSMVGFSSVFSTALSVVFVATVSPWVAAFFALALAMAAATAAFFGSSAVGFSSVFSTTLSVAFVATVSPWAAAFFAFALARAAATAAFFASFSLVCDVVAFVTVPVSACACCLARRRALRCSMSSWLSGKISPFSDTIVFVSLFAAKPACFAFRRSNAALTGSSPFCFASSSRRASAARCERALRSCSSRSIRACFASKRILASSAFFAFSLISQILAFSCRKYWISGIWLGQT